MQIQEKLLTPDDLLEIVSRNPDKQFELLDGILREMPLAFALNSVIAVRIVVELLDYVKEKNLGYVIGADGGYVLFADPYTVRAPDVGFISKQRAPVLPEKYFAVAPDLAVEVVSPFDSASDIHDKVLLFLRAGTFLVWVVYPASKTVAIYTAAGAHIIGEDAVLDGGEVLPGFHLLVKHIFPVND